MINTEDFYGLCTYRNQLMCGVILGSMEQFFNGIMSNVKEFWGKNGMRGSGIGMEIFKEFERRIVKNGVNEIILFTSKGAYT